MLLAEKWKAKKRLDIGRVDICCCTHVCVYNLLCISLDKEIYKACFALKELVIKYEVGKNNI